MKHQRGDFSRNSRILLLSAIAMVIGFIAAFVAKALLMLIALFTNLFYYGEFSLVSKAPSMEHWGILFIFVPVVGGLIIGLMARFGSEKIRGHGIPEALEAILFGKSIMQPKVAILKPFSSAISIGSGGPFGAEGPIIMTGGAVGSLLAQFFHLTSAERKCLLVAGAAAGMSAVFATPIAAVFLAVELLLFEWKPRSLIPVAIASSCAALVRVHLLGAGPIFTLEHHGVFSDLALIAAAGLGVATGVFSAGLSKTLYMLEDMFAKLPIHWMWWPALGGLIVGIGGYFQPRALGVGYDVIGDLLNGQIPPSNLLILFAVKGLIWIVALASGTSGGVLAPLLIFGCALGSLLGPVLPGDLPTGVWALIGMGAIMGGMMRSPFTAIIFCLELTKDSDVLLPLLIASIASYAITVWIMRRSILTEKVARRGYDIFREYNVDPLEVVSVAEVMTKPVQTIPAAYPVERIVADYFTGNKKYRGYPVVDQAGNLVGMITASDVLGYKLQDKANAVDTAEDIANENMITIQPHQSCREAAEKMAALGIGRLPVVSKSESGKILGIVTRSDLLKSHLNHHELEQKRECFFKLGKT